MKIVNKCFSVIDFEKYIENKKIKRKIDKIILHHTLDTVSQWKKGEVSCKYYKKMYEAKGWKSGPHLFVAPEGIWLFTDIQKQGRHANSGNKGSIGIEMVGRYDNKVPSGAIWKNAKAALKILLEKFSLKPKDIHFHREFNSQKSCPGKAITKKWARNQL